MANDILGQILGSVLGSARGADSRSMGGGMDGGGLGDLLGGLLGRGAGSGAGLGGLGGLGGGGMGGGLGGLGGKGAMMALLLPLAMQWVQRNGGIGGVLQRFQQKGYTQQAASWVSTDGNEELAPGAIDDVVGTEELSRLSQQLGVSTEEVSSGMAQILPEMVNHLTPQGSLPDDGDEVLNRGTTILEQIMNSAQRR
ncbi:MAG: hypothetical protein JWR68_893 [Polaromonas sp.]|nr:hypothetical protein [Polaromonas sp.]